MNESDVLSSRPTLEAAMEMFADGDDAAFTLVYRLAAPRLRGLFGRLNEPAFADDLVQEALLRVYRARASYRRGARVLPWIYTIARRLVLDRIRRRRLERAADEIHREYRMEHCAPPRADDELSARRMAAVVAHVVDRLPPGQALAFRLVKEQGLDLSEAAAKLGDTNLALRLKTHRACKAIRQALEAHA